MVMAVGAIVAAIVGGALVAQFRLARYSAELVLSADALRTASAVIHGELLRAASDDVRAVAADSVAIRAFRGRGVVCAVWPDRILVRYRGDRLPEPAKDSLLFLDGAGGGTALPVLDVEHAPVPCAAAADETGLRIRVDAAAPSPHGMILVYESGRYYLSARAMRYRLGNEGRQPLTAEAFVTGRSAFGLAASGIMYRLHTARGDSVHGIAVFGAGVP